MESATHFTEQLHEGVIAALLHVAFVRTPGTAALASEFDAAQHAVKERVQSSTTPDLLRMAFAAGLSLQALKAAAQSSVIGDRRLLGLRRCELLNALDARHRTLYRSLVLAAAEAALMAELEDQPSRRRIHRWERIALREIEAALHH